MRKLASIRTISDIRPIEGRDRIEQVKVDGWNVIVKKDEFKDGDLCVYVEIDSQLPEKPEYEFLKSKKYIIKTMKLSGVRSEGIVFPVSILPKRIKPVVGLDVTKVLGIVQYNAEPEIKVSLIGQVFRYFMRYPWFRRLFKKSKIKSISRQQSTFPHWIRKTDEERIQNVPNILGIPDINWIATEKLDGSSATYGIKIKNGAVVEFVVCSRNQQLTDETNIWWEIAKRYSIREKLEAIMNRPTVTVNDSIVIQGEIIGPKIQGNKYKLEDIDFYVFNVVLDGINCGQVFLDIPGPGLPLKYVPVLSKQTKALNVNYALTVDEVLDLATFQSMVNKETLAEGMVVRGFEPNGYIVKYSYKAVSPQFLIKNNE